MVVFVDYHIRILIDRPFHELLCGLPRHRYQKASSVVYCCSSPISLRAELFVFLQASLILSSTWLVFLLSQASFLPSRPSLKTSDGKHLRVGWGWRRVGRKWVAFFLEQLQDWLFLFRIQQSPFYEHLLLNLSEILLSLMPANNSRLLVCSLPL